MKPSGGWRGPQPPTRWFGINHASPQSAGLEFWIPSMRSRHLNVKELVHGKYQNQAQLGNATTYVYDPTFGFGVNFANDFSKMVINSPNDPALAWFVSLTAFSVSAWIRPSGIQGVIISKAGGTAPTTDPFLLWFSASNNLRFTVVNAAGTRVEHNAGGTWTANRLYHVVGVYDGAVLRCYQDGRQIGATTNQTGLTRNSTTPINLGNVNGSGSGFRGRILDTRIYTRALTPEDVWQMFDPATRFELYQPVEPPKYWTVLGGGGGTVYEEEVSLGRTEGITEAALFTFAESVSLGRWVATGQAAEGGSGGGGAGGSPRRTTKTLTNTLGLSIHVGQPLARGGGEMFSLAKEMNGFSRTVNAFGGYGAASLQLNAGTFDLYDWVQDGLGRDITVFDGDGQSIYNGYVDKVTLNAGAVSVTRGPLSTIANRVSAMYVPIIDDLVDPPVLGSRTETVINEDTASQGKYGIIEKVLSLGNCLDADADQIRDTYLEESREPETSQQVNLYGGGGGELSLTVECSGYLDWLEMMVYNNTATPLSVELSTKIASILTAEQAVNGIFSTDTSMIEFNGVLTSSYEGENRTALAIIKALAAHGDIYDARWLFGVYENRRVHYQAIPTTIEYQHRIHSTNQVIQRPDESKVQPWSVMAGKWLFMPDLLSGFAGDPLDLRSDPRALFIESVTYTAPYGLSINGSRVATLSQKLSKLGLSGVN